MGQAKLKKLSGQYPDLTRTETLARAARAVAFVSALTHDNFGADCVMQAKLLAALLDGMNLPARVAIGHAVWRVGADPVDVVAHHPNTYCGPQSVSAHEGFEGHAWVEVGDLIVDSTTNQWQAKLDRLGRVEGRQPQLDWPHDVLVLRRGRVRSLRSVLRASTFAAHYEELAEFRPALDFHDVDAGELMQVRAAFEAP